MKFEKFDVLICPEALSGYDTFDVKRIDEIYDIGYEAAKNHVSELKKLKES